MKKVIASILALSLCLGFAGCGQKKAAQKEENKKYVIYSDTAFAPFEFLDEKSGKYVGVDMEILEEIAKDQKIEYDMHNDGFKAAMGAVQSGQADAMIAGMTINDERKKTFDFSEGYFEDGQVLVVAKDSAIASEDDLKGKTIAVKNGTMGLEHAEAVADKLELKLSYYEDSTAMYQAVINGVNDACFEDFSVIGWAIEKENIALKTVGNVINPCSYGFAVKKGENAELIKKFNAGLANIKKSGKYDEILTKYGYGDNTEEKEDKAELKADSASGSAA